jgi:large subunit ribosomal protein L24
MKKEQKKTIKSHIRKGDTVTILSGDNKGETGVVEAVFVDEYRAIVKGINLVKRHVRPSADQPGGVVEKEASIHISKLMLMDSKGEASRIKRQRDENGKLVRVSKKSQEVIK